MTDEFAKDVYRAIYGEECDETGSLMKLRERTSILVKSAVEWLSGPWTRNYCRKVNLEYRKNIMKAANSLLPLMGQEMLVRGVHWLEMFIKFQRVSQVVAIPLAQIPSIDADRDISGTRLQLAVQRFGTAGKCQVSFGGSGQHGIEWSSPVYIQELSDVYVGFYDTTPVPKFGRINCAFQYPLLSKKDLSPVDYSSLEVANEVVRIRRNDFNKVKFLSKCFAETSEEYLEESEATSYRDDSSINMDDISINMDDSANDDDDGTSIYDDW